MKLDSIQIQEKDLTISKARDLVIRLIDNQIQNYRLQNISDWERGHVRTLNEENDIVSLLAQKKAELLKKLENNQDENALVDINFKLDLNVKQLNSI